MPTQRIPRALLLMTLRCRPAHR